MVEPVRLIIWDLDETFWSGTLTEGGIRYLKEHHNIVIALAERGIISSICSKNDFATIKDIFERAGLWDYFVFPSIDWSPKGPRLAALVDAVQLRPETILFVDDNPMNLAEAEHFVAGIQTGTPDVIPTMLVSPLFKGKDDKVLSRLQQYKVLERKQTDAATSNDNREFLRSSNIRVRIEYDIIGNIDRAVELINRTNQLNFTKKRLSENIEEARVELKKLVSNYAVQSGLISVTDRYGDYGFVGIYVVYTHMTETRVIHFAFSCRTLGMLVETWLYRYLRRPTLNVSGDVLTDVQALGEEIDWITLTDDKETGRTRDAFRASRLVLRGGCDLLALSHYLEPYVEQVVLETFRARGERHIRIDHSSLLAVALRDITPDQESFLKSLDYRPEDCNSALAHPTGGSEVWVFSFWMDAPLHLYTNGCGISVPYIPLKTETRVEDRFGYRSIGVIQEVDFKSTLASLLDFATPETHIFVILSPALFVDRETLKRTPAPNDQAVNRWTMEALGGDPRCHLIDPMLSVREPSEMPATKHFDRIVYHRIAMQIIDTLLAEHKLDFVS